MSRAYKCDRCGTLYEFNLEDRRDGTLFMGKRPYTNTFFDLCPQCQKEIERWFTYPTRVKQEKPVNEV